MPASVIYYKNDMVLEVSNVKDALTNQFLTTAQVTVTLVNAQSQPVSGQTWPTTLDYVSGTDATYRAVLVDTLLLRAGQSLTAQVTIDGGVDMQGYFEMPVKVELRTV